MREYVVQSGDTLWHIASKTLGPNGDWRVLATLNQIADPKQLRVGQRLKLPSAIADALAPQGNPPVHPTAPVWGETDPYPPGESTAAAASGPTAEYVVQLGDTLRTIANKVLSPGSDWRILATLNGIDDPRQVRVGQRLKIPQRTGRIALDSAPNPVSTPASEPTATPMSAPATPAVEPTYVVQPGDTLTSIASKVLGPGGDWRAIAQLNQIADPKQVRAGQRLRLPSRVNQATEELCGSGGGIPSQR